MGRRRRIDPAAYAALDPGLTVRGKAAALGVGVATVDRFEKALVSDLAAATRPPDAPPGPPAQPERPGGPPAQDSGEGGVAPGEFKDRLGELLASLNDPARRRVMILLRLEGLRGRAQAENDRPEERKVIEAEARVVADIDRARTAQVLVDARSVNVGGAPPLAVFERLLSVVRAELGPSPAFERIADRARQVLEAG